MNSDSNREINKNNQKNVIALVGSPNSGKTTLFNWLTNRKYKTVNYPGATVEYAIAGIAPQWGVSDFEIMDTPGIYSLTPKSEDEEVTYHALFSTSQFGKIKTVIVVVDGTQLARHLVLVTQLKESGFEVIIALTMSDLIRKSGQEVDLKKLESELLCSVILIDGLLGGGIQDLVNKLNERNRISHNEVKLARWDKGAQFKQLEQMRDLASRVLIFKNHNNSEALNYNNNSNNNNNCDYKKNYDYNKEEINKNNDKKNNIKTPLLLQNTKAVDRWLLHPVLGILFFVFIMSFLFTAIFSIAAPFMDSIDSLFASLASVVSNWGEEGNLWSDFLGNGVLTSFGAVFVFVPQIFILFFLLGLLESTGYLARAATLIDKPLSYFGLSGRSFVPILSGFACAVPAIMATRNISSKRDRFITTMIIPLMTCSARLPVYSLLLAFIFREQPAWKAGVSLTLLYLGGLFVGALVSYFLHRLLKKERNSFFMMELPLYRRPRPSVVFNYAWTKTLGYIKRAGPPIFTFALLVWIGTTFPNFKAENDQIKLETSYAGQLGQTIEPLFTPMGVDWRVGVSLISAFAAREVFASSLAVIFNVTAEDDSSLQAGLLDSMSNAKDSKGNFIFTTASVMALLVFVLIALQCTSTTAIVIRETGKISWALGQLVLYNILAYGASVTVFQILK